MSSSISASSQVYIGFWVNWSRGPVNGATITLTRSDGTTLIAFIAFFVAWGKSSPVSPPPKLPIISHANAAPVSGYLLLEDCLLLSAFCFIFAGRTRWAFSSTTSHPPKCLGTRVRSSAVGHALSVLATQSEEGILAAFLRPHHSSDLRRCRVTRQLVFTSHLGDWRRGASQRWQMRCNRQI